MSTNFTMTKTCENCGKSFTAKTLFTRFCGHQCASRNYKKRKREEKVNSHTNLESQRIPYDKKTETINFDKDIFTIQEACSFLSISRMTLHRLLQKGSLSSFKVGHRRLIKKEEILLMIKIYERNEN